MCAYKEVFLIRHAESTYNSWRRRSFTEFRLRDIFTFDPGYRDAALSPAGMADTIAKQQKYRASLKRASACRILTSPLTRALQTTELLFRSSAGAAEIPLPIVSSPASSNPIGFDISNFSESFPPTQTPSTTLNTIAADSADSLLCDCWEEARVFPPSLFPTEFRISAVYELVEWLKTASDIISPDLQSLETTFPEVDFRSSLFLPPYSLRGTEAALNPDATSGVRRGKEEDTKENAEPQRNRAGGEEKLCRRRLLDELWKDRWTQRSARPRRWTRWFKKVRQEPRRELRERANRLRRFLCEGLKDDALCIVGHAYFFKELTGDKKMKNLEMRKYRLDTHSGNFQRDLTFVI